MGLLRRVWKSLGQGPNGNRMPYVYTNPDSDTVLDKVDSVFILAKSLPPHLKTQKMQDVVDTYRKTRRSSTVDPVTGKAKICRA